MAEPARNYEPDEEHGIYDPASSTQPHLHLVGDDDEGSDSDTAAEEAPSNVTNLDDYRKKKAESADPVSPEGLRDAEAHAGIAGEGLGTEADKSFGFNPTDKGGRLHQLIRSARTSGISNKKTLIGGGIGVSIVGLLIAGFLALIPLKLVSIIENIQQRFFGTSESAVQQETKNLFTNYIQKYVSPGLTQCSSHGTIDKTCSAVGIKGNSLVDKLYTGWSQSHLENTLAAKYGIEFRYDKNNRTFYMKAPGTSSGEGDPISTSGDRTINENMLFTEADRGSVKVALNNSLAQETKWKQVLYRFKIGRLLEEKYGIKRCIVACNTKDDFTAWKNNETKAFQVYLTQRIIEPRSTVLSLIIQCVIASQGTCTEDRSGTPDNGEASGAPRSQFESDLQTQLDQFAEKFGQDSVKDLLAKVTTLKEEGFAKFLTDRAVSSVLSNFASDETSAAAGELAGKVATGDIPIVGQIGIAAQIIQTLGKAGPTLKKMEYAANAAEMVNLYMMFRTHADEIKSGNVDAGLVGSFTSALGPGQQIDSQGNATGAGAEATPLYQSVFGAGSNTSGSTALLNDLLPSVYAQSTTTQNSTSYLCDNGKPVPAGQKVCDEERLRGSNFINTLNDVLKTQPLSSLVTLAGVWQNTAGKIFNFIGNAFGSVLSSAANALGVNDAIGAVAGKVLGPLESLLTKYLIPSPISNNMSGGRTVDMLMGGADVANSSSSESLGGQALTPQQSADIVNGQQNEAHQEFNNLSFFARMFDTSSQYSLISNVAMAMPTNLLASAGTDLSSLLSDPFGKLVQGFGVIFGRSGSAFAQATAQPDPFGVTQYGYPAGTIPQDPEVWWNQNCGGGDTADNLASLPSVKAWNDAATIDPETGQPENSTTQPCLLIAASIGSAGAVYSSNVLSRDDLADSGGQ